MVPIAAGAGGGGGALVLCGIVGYVVWRRRQTGGGDAEKAGRADGGSSKAAVPANDQGGDESGKQQADKATVRTKALLALSDGSEGVMMGTRRGAGTEVKAAQAAREDAAANAAIAAAVNEAPPPPPQSTSSAAPAASIPVVDAAPAALYRVEWTPQDEEEVKRRAVLAKEREAPMLKLDVADTVVAVTRAAAAAFPLAKARPTHPIPCPQIVNSAHPSLACK